jgi:hypothetical protein
MNPANGGATSIRDGLDCKITCDPKQGTIASSIDVDYRKHFWGEAVASVAFSFHEHLSDQAVVLIGER